MMRRLVLPFALLLCACAANTSPVGESPERTPNQVLGTWRVESLEVAYNGVTSQPYGSRPNGLLVFMADGHFIEVLTDSDAPRFASDVRGEGTDDENRRAMASSLGFFGRYTVDGHGRFTGNRVDGSTFPNWIGSVRTERELRLEVIGDRMFEQFTRPDGGQVVAVFVRVR